MHDMCKVCINVLYDCMIVRMLDDPPVRFPPANRVGTARARTMESRRELRPPPHRRPT